MTISKERILTGDRPTGPLHLGHYVGSLANRVKLQHEYESYILIADVQALTTHFEHPGELRRNTMQVATDYLAAGLNPGTATILIQSRVPEIHELAMYFSLFTMVNVLRHNPTVKTEAAQHGFNDMPYGFLGYPISQSADISIFKAHLVPVGEDQIPHMELTRKIVRRFNDLYRPVLIEPRELISSVSRLVGLDGKAKMSKSLNNGIFLHDQPAVVEAKVKTAVTDPQRIRKNDPGHPEICTVFTYHKVFNAAEVEEIEHDCRQGTIGCVACKKNLADKLNRMLEPMHERRAVYEQHPDLVADILQTGTAKARKIAAATMEEVREAMQLDYFSKRQS